MTITEALKTLEVYQEFMEMHGNELPKSVVEAIGVIREEIRNEVD